MTTPRDDAPEARRPALKRETTDKREALWKSASASAIGIEMALAVLIGALIGRWLDGHFDSDPLWTLVFVGVGIGAAFRGLIRVARQHQNSLKAQTDAETQHDATSTRAS